MLSINFFLMARLYSVIFRLRRLFSRTGNLVHSDNVHFGILSMNILMQNEGLVTDIDCNDNRNAYSYLPAFLNKF